MCSEYDLLLSRNCGLGGLLYDQALNSPSATAVSDDDIALTYGQLHAIASKVAANLIEKNIGTEEPVGIVALHGIAGILAQVAIIYAGGTCVPMDSTLPNQQLQRRLKRLNARFVITDQYNQGRDLPFIVIPLSLATTENETYTISKCPVSTTLEHCTHLIHTSGTTTEPKIVRIAARSILHVIYHAPFEPLRATDVVAHSNNTSFDISLFDIWAPLLRGARIVIVDKTILLDLPRLEQHISCHSISVFLTTTALLNLIAFNLPKVLAKLRLCIFGGEMANTTAISIILREAPPEMLVNGYGPTECCIFCLAHQVTAADVQSGSISIGAPIGHNIAHIIDDMGQPSNEGELLVAGPGVSRGYVDDAMRNATAFSTITNLPKAEAHLVRLYRTGDVVRRRSDGKIEYVGRHDHQVKIRGFLIELGAVEIALLQTGLVAEAVALKIDIPYAGAGSILVAYGVPAAGTDRGILAGCVTEAMKSVVPDYMVPRLELILRMPLNNHGKVDRKSLTDQFCQKWDQNVMLGRRPDDTRSKLLDIWCKIMGSRVSTCNDSDDFVLLGGSSLQAVMLLNQIRLNFQIEISMSTLYANSNVEALLSVIRLRLEGGTETVLDEMMLWEADSKIADDLPTPSGPVTDWVQPSEGHVFLTGATGFLGAFLLADLLETPHVRQVSCLVRAAGTMMGLERLKTALGKYGLWKDCFQRKILVLLGRVEDEYFSLEQEQYKELTLRAGVVFHLAALVDYTKPYSLHRPANTIGTVNVVRFACAGRIKPIHYVSSISCFGPTGYVTGATSIREDEPLLKHIVALPYDNGYAQSQWVADQLMCRLIDRGFPIAIYRPGFITGHSQTGACNPNDFFGRLVKACYEMGCYPNLPGQRKEFLPVDFVSAVVLHIASSPASLGRAYHIVPRDVSTSIDMNDTMELVAASLDTKIVPLPFAEWVQRLEDCSQQSLLPLQTMLREKVYDGRTRWELWEKMPVYDVSNLCEALATSPYLLEFPVMSFTLMKRYVGFLRTTSWT